MRARIDFTMRNRNDLNDQRSVALISYNLHPNFYRYIRAINFSCIQARALVLKFVSKQFFSLTDDKLFHEKSP